MTPCIEFKGTRKASGYGQKWVPSLGKVVGAHKAAWLEQIGPIPPGKQVLHKCDNPPCVNIDHLFLGSIEDNMRDMTTKGRASLAKLTPEQVREVRRLYATKQYTQKDLAALFGVGQPNISYIVRGATWTGV